MLVSRIWITTVVVLALTLLLVSQERAPAQQAVPLLAYEMRDAYTTFDDQVLEGRRVVPDWYEMEDAYTTFEDQVLEGRRVVPDWIVPVLLPNGRQARGRAIEKPVVDPRVEDTSVIWEAIGEVPPTAPDVIVDGVNLGPAQQMGRPLSHLFMATFPLSRKRTKDTSHDVQLMLNVRGILYQSRLDRIILRPTTPFLILLPTFRHDRCENCHSLQTSELTHAFHAGFDIDLPADPRCSNCHLPSFTGLPGTGGQRWRPPTTYDAPNFRAIDGAGDLCEAVLDRATANKDPGQSVFAFLREHFHDDKRMHWAVVNGRVPFQDNPLPTAPPHDLTKLREYADWWLLWAARVGDACTGLP